MSFPTFDISHLKLNLVTVLLCPFLLVTTAFRGSVFGQDVPKPEQIDLFSRLSCDELGIRSHYFANQISVDPNSKGLVIVHTSGGSRNVIKRQLRQVLTHFLYFNAEDRVEFVLSPEVDGPNWEFWKIPAGAAEPDHGGEKWNFPVPDITKAFIYDIEDENGICSTFVTRKFAELLINNPGSRAHIVVKKSTMDTSYSSKGLADQWIEELTTKYSISRNRIRAFYFRGDNALTYAEFWFVPAKITRTFKK